MRGLCYLILSILSRVYGSTVRVVGVVGHNVTLPCAYDALSYGSLSFCWGKDTVPTFKCSNTILSWTGGAAPSRWGPRYQLKGTVDDGDVSLIIVSADWSDAGVYGCRVEIPGPFNDLKVNIKLVIEEAPEEEPTVSPSYTEQNTEGSTVSPQTPEFQLTHGAHVLRTSSEQELDLFIFLGVENMGRLAAVLLVTIILILLFIFWRRLLPAKTMEQSETSAPENVYESIPLH